MPWFNVDDGFAFHHKAIRAGNTAIGLWTRAGSWCSQQLTDGHVPDAIVAVLGTPKQADRLVAAGLWARVPNGYQFHEWGEDGRNPSRESVLAKRRREADKKRRQRSDSPRVSEEPQVDHPGPQGSPPGSPDVVPGGVDVSTPLPSLTTKRSRRKTGGYTSEFEQWWKAYPSRDGGKGSKFAASKAWSKALTLTTVDGLIAATKRYADSPRVRDGFAKDAATWLNQRCWEDQAGAESPADVTAWLKAEWQAGRVREIEQRTGLHYRQPDIPAGLATSSDIEAWLLAQSRKWIADNHKLITDRLASRRTA